MKLNDNFVLRNIAGEHILLPVGEQTTVTSGIVALSSVAAIIWETLKEDPTYNAALAAILEQFDVSEEIARSDLDTFLVQMKEADLLELQ